jgi:hypothetical protein
VPTEIEINASDAVIIKETKKPKFEISKLSIGVPSV